jgi:UDP-GlcNAc:undecaprenyl-phosphate/decaprenyl-phosphate GlcNAc-1-phosphate transferase
MILPVLALIPIAFAISLPLTAAMMLLGRRLKAFDSPGVAGQVKAPARRVPNTGGVAIFWAIALPLIAGLAAIWLFDLRWVQQAAPAVALHLEGMRIRTPLAITLIASMALLHLVGLVDDRRPLGPWLKLAIMAVPAVALPVMFEETRLLELMDTRFTGGVVLSITLTALWFLIVTNAMNFLDNMDGLSAGVAAIAGGCFLGASLVIGQWFVAAVLALLIGACLGFLIFNFPQQRGARIFMGDGGSLVLGFLLAFLTVRVTYYEGPDGPLGGGWYAVFMPLVVLAVPIYDFVSVVSIRISQGKSPFVGDMQHLSHRLVNLGLSRRAAVLVIYGLTVATGISGIVLGSLRPWQAVLVGIQIIVLLGVIALFEYARSRSVRPVDSPAIPRPEPREAQHV